jgi:hypothetical protein
MLRSLILPGTQAANNVSQSYSQAMTIRLGTRANPTAKSDGGLFLTRQGTFTGSARYGKVPLVSVEVSVYRLCRITSC